MIYSFETRVYDDYSRVYPRRMIPMIRAAVAAFGNYEVTYQGAVAIFGWPGMSCEVFRENEVIWAAHAEDKVLWLMLNTPPGAKVLDGAQPAR